MFDLYLNYSKYSYKIDFKSINFNENASGHDSKIEIILIES